MKRALVYCMRAKTRRGSGGWSDLTWERALRATHTTALHANANDCRCNMSIDLEITNEF